MLKNDFNPLFAIFLFSRVISTKGEHILILIFKFKNNGFNKIIRLIWAYYLYILEITSQCRQILGKCPPPFLTGSTGIVK